MLAMRFEAVGRPLHLQELATPVPVAMQVLVRVAACAVCRTDLHVVDGELPEPKLPLTPGHEIVGHVVAVGDAVEGIIVGQRVGVAWLGWSCGHCAFCQRGEENLCPSARFTGYQLDGGFATHVLADARYVFALPPGYSDQDAAPLMCAGLIGYRSLKLAGEGRRLGLYGFGAAAHIAIQVARSRDQEVYAFVRPGDVAGQNFAREMGAVWAGGSDQPPPFALDAAILFAPVGALVPTALRAIRPGGRVICGGIHMSDIPGFPYAALWGERSVASVANLTRADGEEFLALAGQIKIHTHTLAYRLDEANTALADVRGGRIKGAAVLLP